jgi:hypothetical protein
MKTNHLVRVFLLAGLVLFGTQLFAANLFEIRGKVVKGNSASENVAKVYLLDSKTMELVGETESNENGEFLFEEVGKGHYVLMVIKPGYRKADTRYITITEKGTTVNSVGSAMAELPVKIEKTQTPLN